MRVKHFILTRKTVFQMVSNKNKEVINIFNWQAAMIKYFYNRRGHL